MKRERDHECWDGGHAFGKKLALEIALQIQTRESTLVQNLRKEIADYQRENQSLWDVTPDFFNVTEFCVYCFHRRKEFTDKPEECLYCKTAVPCEEYCVNIRGMDADICPGCANKNI